MAGWLAVSGWGRPDLVSEIWDRSSGVIAELYPDLRTNDWIVSGLFHPTAAGSGGWERAAQNRCRCFGPSSS